MPHISGDENSLKKEFQSLLEKTGNLSVVKGALLERNPRLIRIFRMILGLTLEEMAELIDRKYATISQYERGIIQSEV